VRGLRIAGSRLLSAEKKEDAARSFGNELVLFSLLPLLRKRPVWGRTPYGALGQSGGIACVNDSGEPGADTPGQAWSRVALGGLAAARPHRWRGVAWSAAAWRGGSGGSEMCRAGRGRAQGHDLVGG